MTRPTADSPDRRLVGDLRRELSAVEEQIRSHGFLAALDDGQVPRERLAALAGEHNAIISGDRRSFALLASRFPEPAAGDLFLSLAEGERRALELLRAFSSTVGGRREGASRPRARTRRPGLPGLRRLACAQRLAQRREPRAARQPRRLGRELRPGSRARCTAATGSTTGRSRSSPSSSSRRRTPSSACWRCSTRASPTGVRPVGARRGARLLFWDTLAEGIG